MPELPEIETYRRLLQPLIVHKSITDVAINRSKSVNVPPDVFSSEIRGQSVIFIERRGKHLVFHLSGGKVMLLHLMLGGWIFFGPEKDKPDRTVQVDLSFRSNHLFFIGLRLGFLHLLTLPELQDRFASLGPEPLEPTFSSELFLSRLGSKKGMLKPVLIDQHFVAGIGNCYADEICYHAFIRPNRKVNELNEQQQIDLYRAIDSVLHKAVDFGGYIERPLFVGDVITGGYNELCQVYDREGEPCLRCGGTILHTEIASRKTFYCPECQA